MNYSPWKAGLMQAVGLVAYILLFATIVSHFNGRPDPQPFVAITMFLMAFVISATICGSIGLIYPVKLIIQGQIKEALQVILWNVGWLVIFFLIVLGLNFR